MKLAWNEFNLTLVEFINEYSQSNRKGKPYERWYGDAVANRDPKFPIPVGIKICLILTAPSCRLSYNSLG